MHFKLLFHENTTICTVYVPAQCRSAVFLAAKPRHEVYEKITVRAFELVDKKGVVRVAIQSYDDGEVVFRMKDAKGTIRVKMGAGEDGSGLVLLNDATEPEFMPWPKRKALALP